jgi:hypothetical protein
MHSAEIATAVGVDAGVLHRVLRGLAAEGILDEQADGRFGLTPLSDLLRTDAAGSMRGAALVRGDLYYTAAAGLMEAVREGGIAFDRAHGRSFFEHLAAEPELMTGFQTSMVSRSTQEARDVLASYDFGRFERVVDIGGGTGILLRAILEATPGLRCVLFDQPKVIDAAREQLAGSDIEGRIELVPGDFFTAVPGGGDAYLLSRVIHDWDDDAARRILETCRSAMPAEGTLLLVEAVLPERAAEQPAAIRMDLHMLVLLPGRERTGPEFETLLTGAGFGQVRIIPTASPLGISVIEAHPAG